MVIGNILAGAAGAGTVFIVIKAVDQFSGTFNKVDKRMMAVAGGLAAVGIAGLGAIAGLTKLAGQFEQTKIAFTTMLGDGEKAKKLLKELADFATKTPFTITDVEKNAKLLLAMGIETEKILPTLKALGDVSAGLSVPLERIALNFGQVRTQGRLTGRELRDFNVAGVPLIAELAKNLNLSEAAIKGMVSAGAIGFEDVENAFISMSGEGGKFFDLMDAQSKTFLGQVSNIQDSLIKIGRVMGDEFLPAATAGAEALGKFISFLEEHPILVKLATVLLAAGTALALVAAGVVAFMFVFNPLVIVITGFVGLMGLAFVAGMGLAKLFDENIIPAFKRGEGIISGVVEVLKELLSIFARLQRLPGAIGGLAGVIGSGLGIPSFAKGGVMPHTGLAMVHKGETITPANKTGGVTVIIEGDIVGLDAESISKALSDELSEKVTL